MQGQWQRQVVASRLMLQEVGMIRGGAGHVSYTCPEGRLLYRTCVLYLSYTCPMLVLCLSYTCPILVL